MPQMSPMSWMFISSMMLSVWFSLKVNLNNHFFSKNKNKLNLMTKKYPFSW